MLKRKGIPLAALVAVMSATGIAQEAPKVRELTARELFYTPVAAAKPSARQADTKAAAVKPTARPVKPAPLAAAVRPPRQSPPTPAPTEHARPAPPATPDGAAIVPAAVRRTAPPPPPSSGPPLGLRYTITRLSDGQMVEVAPDSVFRAGDRIRITVVPNSAGYLYIVNQGSSGTWKPIFPSAEIEGGSNKVEGFRDYAMPPKSRLIFDSQPGTERLFLILSREPEPDLEQIIYSLQAPTAQPAAAPAPDAPSKEPPRTMIAANIGDDLVGRMRNVYARDLVIEQVSDETPGDKKEKAVYVVNASGSPDSRVVADISLVHQ